MSRDVTYGNGFEANGAFQPRRAVADPIVCVGLYNCQDRRIERVWIGQQDTDGHDATPSVADALSALVRRPPACRTQVTGSGERVDWIVSDRALIALGGRVGAHRPVSAMLDDGPGGIDTPARRHLIRIGLCLARERLSRDTDQGDPAHLIAKAVLQSLSVSVAVVDKDGTILYRSRLSDEWLSRSCRMRVVHDRLMARSNAAQASLMDAVRAATSAAPHTSVLRMSGHDGQGRGVAVMPLYDTPSRALLVFARTGEDAVILRDLVLQTFDLTRAERRLAECLLSGRSLSDAAAELGLKVSTARSYLKRIFSKTGITRQSEFVALYHSLVPPVRGWASQPKH